MDFINDVLPQLIPFALTNVALSMFAVAAVFMLLHRIVTLGRVSQYEIVYRWTAFFAVGCPGIYAFALQILHPEWTAHAIGWMQSPFQYEVAMADLGFGLIAILSFNASYGFRLATVLANACWLWGNASGQVYQVVIAHDLGINNSGSWFWMDLLLPLILFLCIGKLKPKTV